MSTEILSLPQIYSLVLLGSFEIMVVKSSKSVTQATDSKDRLRYVNDG